MKLSLTTLALATVSCSQPASRPHGTRPPHPVTDGITAATADVPVPTPHKPRAAVEAPHSGAIQLLAATPDATAVLTLDEMGGARLWPSLDGTQEPRVVELPSARELALGKTPTGYSAVLLDESGGLYIAKLDTQGRTLSHTTHGIDPAYAGIAMSTTGAIGWRVDHHVLRIDEDGAIKDQLGTEPQQRIVDVAVAGNRAVAVLEDGGTRKVRWLDLVPKLEWGAWLETEVQGEMGASIALAPDFKHVAVAISVDKVGQRVVILDDKGKQVTSRDFAGSVAEIKFADANLLAVGSAQGLSWIVVSTQAPASPATQVPGGQQRNLLAAGGGRAIWPSNGELMLLTPSETKFLGYDTLAPRLAQTGPDGGVLLQVGAPATTFRVLDKDLRAKAKLTMGLKPNAVPSEVQWLGGNDWLLEASRGGQATLELFVVDGVTDSYALVRGDLAEAHVLAFEPSTELATLSFGGAAEVARLDRKNRTLDKLASVTPPSAYEQIVFVPLAPKLARGNQLLQITLRDKPMIKWLADPRALDKPSAALTLDGAYAAADAAGHVYAWRTVNGKLQLAVYTDGKLTATLPASGPATLWPSPQGTLIAEVGEAAVTLYRADGTQVWTRETSGAQEALWLTDGALALTHASGVARLDPKTGGVTAARCGWDFGLSTKPHPIAPRIEPVCLQLMR